MANQGLESDQPQLAGVVHRNIETLLRVREQLNDTSGLSDRIAAAIGNFAGSMAFVYIHLAIFGVWILVNLRPIFSLRPFDPFPFVMLATIASLEAIFLSTFVLITQNRMAVMADKRAELDLQINLLAEHEVTRLIAMVEDVSRHLGIRQMPADEIEELKTDVNPEQVWQQIVKAEEERGGQSV